ncbi:diguanylate cyclase [Marispirochaeta aestuarii]|uniref:GGDEF domain-containing protein n=1 Tax=Marispirochaeta aestuarii TaxID=1963862 RepID=UPI0029C75D35|nr:diguanylate cyclase [Marispirochaeta aestuarii]
MNTHGAYISEAESLRFADKDGIESLIHQWFCSDSLRLTFPGVLEDLFETDTGRRRANRLYLRGTAALLFYLVFLLADYYMVPDIFRSALVVRFGIVLPLSIVAIIYLSRNPSPFKREVATVFIFLIVVLSLIYLFFISRHQYASSYHLGLILILIFANQVTRLRFYYAMALSFLTLAVYCIFLLLHPLIPGGIKIHNMLFLAAAAVMSLISNYSLEKENRINYLFALQEKIKILDLSDRNKLLHEISRIDPLTGIPNRRHLEIYLDTLQQSSSLNRLAIILIDLDFFKKYNDHYGHQQGDNCLQKVVSGIKQELRNGADLFARYGGEEFIVVLPDLGIHEARSVALRLCERTEKLAMPHEAAPAPRLVTISCGVASAEPPFSAGFKDLIRRADQALYRAKSEGRNRVME